MTIPAVEAAFAARFGAVPAVVARAPGRVNLIGEHTDYNAGFVLPMAIDRATVFAARPQADATLHAYAANLDAAVSVDLTAPITRQPEAPWVDYLLGVMAQWQALGHPLPGMDVLVAGDVPIGCGLSSSASLTMATLSALEALTGTRLDPLAGAVLGQRVENDFLGLACGMMDPFVVRMARAGHAVLLDCRSHAYEHIPAAFPDAAFLIANTGVTRGLTASRYNERVAECAAAVRALNAHTGRSDTTLRAFSEDEVAAAGSALGSIPWQRARHVVAENARTLAAAEVLRAGDAAGFGALMDASHASLRDDYEVSCAELDAMVAIARQHAACLGARMTGAGFGGCAVLLVDRGAAEACAGELLTEYRRQTGIEGTVILSQPAAGARAYSVHHEDYH